MANMDEASKQFKRALNKWLEENTAELEESEMGECPVCGEWAGEEIHLLQPFGHTSATGVSMTSGPFDATDWKELRQCEFCLSFFIWESSNY